MKPEKMTPRQRIKALQAIGMTGRAISEQTGISLELVGKVMGGTHQRHRLESARVAERKRDDEFKALHEYGVPVTYDEIEKSRRWS